jgi:hypothetical protein
MANQEKLDEIQTMFTTGEGKVEDFKDWVRNLPDSRERNALLRQFSYLYDCMESLQERLEKEYG